MRQSTPTPPEWDTSGLVSVAHAPDLGVLSARLLASSTSRPGVVMRIPRPSRRVRIARRLGVSPMSPSSPCVDNNEPTRRPDEGTVKTRRQPVDNNPVHFPHRGLSRPPPDGGSQQPSSTCRPPTCRVGHRHPPGPLRRKGTETSEWRRSRSRQWNPKATYWVPRLGARAMARPVPPRDAGRGLLLR
jgi:hypothetical protein